MVWVERIVTNTNMKKFKETHQILQVWFSSSFPIGSYAYSHGLEALIDCLLYTSPSPRDE